MILPYKMKPFILKSSLEPRTSTKFPGTLKLSNALPDSKENLWILKPYFLHIVCCHITPQSWFRGYVEISACSSQHQPSNCKPANEGLLGLTGESAVRPTRTPQHSNLDQFFLLKTPSSLQLAWSGTGSHFTGKDHSFLQGWILLFWTLIIMQQWHLWPWGCGFSHRCRPWVDFSHIMGMGVQAAQSMVWEAKCLLCSSNP